MLEAIELSFEYNAGSPDAIAALRGINFQIKPGELVAVIGHNGSGKSTLAKLLSGTMLATSGAVQVDQVSASASTIWEIRRQVGLVFQRPDDQLVANTVIDDIAFGPENLGLPRDEIERRITSVLAALGLSKLANSQISELSGGEKQRVAIAGVLAMQPAYVILDEPTTMIAPALAQQLLRLISDLRQQIGLAVVHITHFMHELIGFDRVVVMDAGRIHMTGTPREIFARADELRAIGLSIPQVTELGRRLSAQGISLPGTILTATELRAALEAFRRTQAAQEVATPTRQIPQPQESQNSRALIETRALRFSYMAGTPMMQEALRGVSCAIYEGETFAILGGTQAGKSTLIEFFNGLRKPASGQVLFEGQDIHAAGFKIDTLRQAIGIVFQQPESQLFEDTVGKDVSFTPRSRKLAPAESRALVQQALTDVGLDYETYRLRYVYALSGGQKRRVAIAGVLAAQPRVLILDEPVAGLDPRSRADLARLIIDLTTRLKLTVVLVGNAIDELAELADRALVLHEGRVVMEGPLRVLLQQADQLHDYGLELSEPAEIALALRGLFPDLPTDLLRLDELEQELITRLRGARDGS
jgi:energy-coupling factor transport system ATP-binding protein